MGATLKLFALYFGTVCFPLVFTRVTRTSPARTNIYIKISRYIHNINGYIHGFIYMLQCWTMFSMEFRLVVVLFFSFFSMDIYMETGRCTQNIQHCMRVYDDGDCFPAQLCMRACVFVCQLVVLDTRRTIFHTYLFFFFYTKRMPFSCDFPTIRAKQRTLH